MEHLSIRDKERLMQMRWTEGDLEVASTDDEYNMLKCVAFEEGAARQLEKADLEQCAFMVRFHAIIYQAIVEQVREQDVDRVYPGPLRDVVEPRCQNLQFQEGTNFEREWEMMFAVRDLSLSGAGVYLNRIKKRFGRRVHRLRMMDLRDRAGQASEDELVSEDMRQQVRAVAEADLSIVDRTNYIITPDKQREVASQFGIKEMETFSTGFSEWDRRVAPGRGEMGMLIGGVHTISGHTGQGKSTLAHTILKHAVKEQGVPSALLNFELTRDEMIYRLASAFVGTNAYARSKFVGARVQGGMEESKAAQMWRQMWSEWSDTYEDMVNSGLLYVAQSPPRDWDDTKALISDCANNGTKVVFIDTINRLSDAQSRDRRHAEMADILKDLDGLADDLDVALVITAQENRNKQQRQNKRPVLYDIAESSELAKVSNSVTQIFRSDIHEDKSYVEGIVNKSRGVGRTADNCFPMQWNPDSGLYKPMVVSERDV
jgi:replicative DNA helicase